MKKPHLWYLGAVRKKDQKGSRLIKCANEVVQFFFRLVLLVAVCIEKSETRHIAPEGEAIAARRAGLTLIVRSRTSGPARGNTSRGRSGRYLLVGLTFSAPRSAT